MKNIINKKITIFSAITLFIILLTVSCSTAVKRAAPLEKDDLTISYKNGEFSLLSTPYRKFTNIAGNTGIWEDDNRFHYTWNEGQAGFITVPGLMSPQLAMITLSENFTTPRGIKKGSTTDELLNAYPENFSTSRGGNGTWYEYRWTIKDRPGLTGDNTYRLSFFVEKGVVDSVMLRLESKEADEIPVG
ncbi:MAG TPA: hypothetical protein PK358_15915 [Spirochaetota bacterium]|nr:hypothetical protein [Spirochaetota bacterium]HPJ36326.1 hypothetical protein [Spirochaetota bacterium]